MIIIEDDSAPWTQALANLSETIANGIVPVAIDVGECDRCAIVGWERRFEEALVKEHAERRRAE